jgi:hypothetical protein
MNDTKVRWLISHLYDDINPEWEREKENIFEYILELNIPIRHFYISWEKSWFTVVLRKAVNSSLGSVYFIPWYML